jgi:hypothetical protein
MPPVASTPEGSNP